MLDDFENHFDLFSKGNEDCVSNGSGFDITEFVQSISKSIFKECLNLANFHISQVKIEMIVIHCIIMKVLFRNPR